MTSSIICSFILLVVKDDTQFSEWENRYLEQRPKLTFSSFLDSSFGKSYETYINEQFPFRKQWIQIKAGTEQAIGKLENNGIVKGEQGYLFTKQMEVGEQISKNINVISNFAKKQKKDIYVGIIPNSYGILTEQLPKGLPNINQKKWIKKYETELTENENIHVLSMKEALEQHKNEPIFYHTDHHWTTLGAYYGYERICNVLNEKPIPLNQLKSSTIHNFYGTLDAKYKGVGIKPDNIIYYHIPVKKISINGKEKNSLYDMEKINKRDKYAMFLHGNNNLIKIKTNQSKKGKLLMIKDSYSNSLIPFLTLHFREIYVIDLRYFTGSVSKLMEEKKIDKTIFLYNFDTLMSDNHLYRLK